MNFFLIKKIKLVALTLFIVSTISLIGSILLHNFLVNFKIDYPILFIKEFHDVKSGEKIKILCNETNEYCYNESFVEKSISKNNNLLDCNKFKNKHYFSLNDEIEPSNEKKIFIYNGKSRKPKNDYLNENIYTNISFTNELDSSCIKNRPFLKKTYAIFPSLIEKIINFKSKLTLGTSYQIFPFIYGETSISNIVKRYPINIIFKVFLFIASIFMLAYWINFNNFFLEFTKKKYNVFLFFGVFSAIFLFLHIVFLGMVFENKLIRSIQKLPIILFILCEVFAQIFLTKALYNFKNNLLDCVKKQIIYLKIIYILIIFLISIYMVILFATSEINSKTEYIFEWNYFSGLLIYYFLSFLMWKKINS